MSYSNTITQLQYRDADLNPGVKTLSTKLKLKGLTEHYGLVWQEVMRALFTHNIQSL